MPCWFLLSQQSRKIECRSRYYCPSNSIEEQECLPGSYNNESGASECKACEDGTFTSSNASTSCEEWKTCAIGSGKVSNGSKTTDRTCQACDGINKYSDVNDSTSCKDIEQECDGVNNYESQAPSSSQNRICSPIRAECSSNEYEKQVPSSTQDRICAACPAGTECPLSVPGYLISGQVRRPGIENRTLDINNAKVISLGDQTELFGITTDSNDLYTIVSTGKVGYNRIYKISKIKLNEFDQYTDEEASKKDFNNSFIENTGNTFELSDNWTANGFLYHKNSLYISISGPRIPSEGRLKRIKLDDFTVETSSLNKNTHQATAYGDYLYAKTFSGNLSYYHYELNPANEGYIYKFDGNYDNLLYSNNSGSSTGNALYLLNEELGKDNSDTYNYIYLTNFTSSSNRG